MKSLISFFEIPSTDFARAVDFYQTVLGEELQISECGEEKLACFTVDGETVGAVYQAPGFQPSSGGVLIHFNCPDIEAALERAVQKGGGIVIPKTKILAEGKGCFAVFADPDGNRVGLYAE